jgi:hypothetical protein
LRPKADSPEKPRSADWAATANEPVARTCVPETGDKYEKAASILCVDLLMCIVMLGCLLEGHRVKRGGGEKKLEGMEGKCLQSSVEQCGHVLNIMPN